MPFKSVEFKFLLKFIESEPKPSQKTVVGSINQNTLKYCHESTHQGLRDSETSVLSKTASLKDSRGIIIMEVSTNFALDTNRPRISVCMHACVRAHAF